MHPYYDKHLYTMKREDFNFVLPPELIAQYPLPNRVDSRLLVHHRATSNIAHKLFQDLPDLLQAGDLLVMNDSRVIPARLYGRKASGGHVELLVERILDNGEFLAHIKASKSPKSGSIIHLDKDYSLRVLGREDDLYRCAMDCDVDGMLHDIGHIPLPPYITRSDDVDDLDRYQTVYARHKGSVAAPTAGLHFDDVLIERLKIKGVAIAYATLHVGAGTFRPVRCEDIKDHQMHYERFHVSEDLCQAVHDTRTAGGRVIAVGTTAMRCLESAASAEGVLTACRGDTNIFITPGYQFKLCDGLITNFHLPESTLLMLVAAFIGYDAAMSLYEQAIQHQYRFFSYGDASLLL
jgi:S-adenosylmethionine:tRNA ribosyltransferase-isomerase